MRPMSVHWPRLVAALVALFLVAACATNDSPSSEAATTTLTRAPATSTTTEAPTTTEPDDDRPWPDEEWPLIEPEAAGLDPEALEALARQAEEAGSSCLVVTRDGQLVAEWYWAGTGPESEAESFSVTKSITATLVGIAQDDGVLDLDQPAADFIHEWRDTPSEAVTIRNLLANDSGRFHDNATDYGSMAFLADDKTQFSIDLEQQYEPGTVWVYNNAAIQTLEAVLEQATGMPVTQFAQERLFDPLGMKSSLTTDRAGNALVFMGMQTSCRDLSRVGLLYLRDGEWVGDQVVSAAFVAEATAPSTSLRPSYGLLWWLLGDAGVTAPGQSDLEGGGAKGYAALGAGDQILAVFPDRGITVTRLGPGGSFGIGDITTWAAAAQ